MVARSRSALAELSHLGNGHGKRSSQPVGRSYSVQTSSDSQTPGGSTSSEPNVSAVGDTEKFGGIRKISGQDSRVGVEGHQVSTEETFHTQVITAQTKLTADTYEAKHLLQTTHMEAADLYQVFQVSE